ncbi:MAG: thioesterase [Ponticaulis sp.]|nr:thioesterase [Ponticaulis sp.]
MTDQTSVPPALSDAEMLARFQNAKSRPACSETLGMKLEEINQADKTLRMSFDVSGAFSNPTGAVQGGFLTAMLDEAMSVCCIIASNVTMTAPTLEIKTSYFRPLFPGRAEAQARILRWGRSTAFMEAELFGADGKMVAKASATAALKLFKKF